MTHAVLTNEAARPETVAGARDILAALGRADPAAMVAVGLFVAVWPALFVGAHVVKLRA